MRLYELAAEYQQLQAKLLDMDIDEQAIADTLEGAAGDFEQKALAVAAVIRNLQADAEAVKAFAKRKLEQANALHDRADKLREYLAHHMRETKILGVVDKAQGLQVRLQVARDKAVELDDNALELLPLRFLTPARPTISKRLISEALEAGETVPGARLVKRDRLTIE